MQVQSCDRYSDLYVDEMMERNRDKKTGLAANLPTTSHSGIHY